MACPQKENGYTPIANEIMEHLAMPGISGSEFRILMVVFRKTYGFQKTKDTISLSQFEKLTYMKRAQAVKTLKELVAKRILLKEGNAYKFNKNWEEWGVAKRIPSSQKDTEGGSQKDTETGSQLPTHKRKKENIKETIAEASTAKLIPEVIHLFSKINPACKNYYSIPVQRQACLDLVETYGFDEISHVIAFLPKNNSTPYKKQANTPKQLWENYVAIKNGWLQEKNKLQINQREVLI
jgi:phage replication O-like protein O